MDWRAQCAAVIPCLNEAAAIGPLVREVRSQLNAVLVVDDGSTDATAELAREAGAEVTRHDSVQGKGASLRTGWNAARQRGYAWALCLDGDGQHSPGDICTFFHCAEQTGAALVIGNRMLNTGGMPWLRRAVNRWMSRRLSIAAGRPLPDSQCGFRLMNLAAWAKLPLMAAHFEVESEVLLTFIRARYKVEFVPIRAIYKNEQSKIHPLVDTVRWLTWWRRSAGKPR